MRPEMLKRLDEILADDGERCDGLEPHLWQELRAEWLTLREELVAERCDACRWWRGTSEPGHVVVATFKPLRWLYQKSNTSEVGLRQGNSTQVQRCAYIDTHMYPNACCSHFEKKSHHRGLKLVTQAEELDSPRELDLHDATKHAAALRAERDTAITRVEKAEDAIESCTRERDRARALINQHVFVLCVGTVGGADAFRAALADEPPKKET